MHHLRALLPLLLLCASCSPATTSSAAAPAPAFDEGAFVVLYGRDTVAVERFRRSADHVSGELVVNRLVAAHFDLDLLPDETVERLFIETRRLDRPTASRDSLLLVADSMDVTEGRAHAEAPYLDRSFVMLEQIVRRAQAKRASAASDDTIPVRVHRVIGAAALPVSVTLHSNDSATVEFEGRTFEIRMNDGRLVRARLADHGILAQRVGVIGPNAYLLENIDDAPLGATYRQEDVSIPSAEGVVLAGTLALPEAGSAGPGDRFPAVVLITGAGEVNRHGGNPPSAPFRQIADELARRGVAVLRLDDRGVAQSTGDRATATLYTEKEDIEAALRFLQTRNDIDARRLGLIGHSEGGVIAPLIAAGDTMVSLVVTIAAVGGPAREMVEYQIRAIIEDIPSIPEEDRESVIAAQIERQYSGTPKTQSIVNYDSALAVIARVDVPLLVLHGMADVHVPPAHAEALAAAARAGGNSDVTVRLFPGLNHNLHPDPRGHGRGWPYVPSFDIPDEVLETIGEWVARTFEVRRPG